MLKKVVLSNNADRAFLSQYRLPAPAFALSGKLHASLLPIWDALNTGNPTMARARATHALEEKRLFSADERAALMVGLGAAELFAGSTDKARRQAGRALDLFPHQWMAHRLMLTVLTMQQAYKAAYLHLVNLDLSGPVPGWDEPINAVERQLALASWSWMLGDWELVAEHLRAAYPRGIDQMPTPVLEDWFRLSLYRDRPEDAAAAAALLITDRPIEAADELLQTIVQNGWVKQALPLYRTAYASAPASQLLRRRLVALCIREGELEEARALTKPGALRIAA